MTLADQAARDRIVSDLDVTMVVEAAAGTGKTTALVGRIVEVVALGYTTLDKIVAVTFTEKAAGELKFRVREEVEQRRQISTGPAERARLDGALEKLEEARIGTIHSFCRDLLQERPVEAGIDPLFAIAPQDEADALLHSAFDRWFEEALRAPGPGLSRMLARADNDREETPTRALFGAALELSQWRDFPAQWSRPAFDRDREIGARFAEMSAIGDLADLGHPDDWLYESLAKIRLVAREAVRLEKIRGPNLDAREAALMKLLRGSQNYWNWKGFGEDFGDIPRAEVMRRREEFHRGLEALRERIGADLAPQLRRELQPVVDRFQELKRRAGKLDFMDLLLLTRDMVKDRAEVRRELQERFTHIFIDEFQDTDPLQAEILLLLAADDPDEKDFRRARPVAGKLFIVGDPKQSIYRFRRADVALYQRVKTQLVGRGARLEHLSVSFRARPELQSMVNSAIAPRMEESETQSGYEPLKPAREDSPQPPIVALPVPKPYGDYGRITNYAIDASLPSVIAAFVHWLVRESGWKVTEGGKPAEELRAIEPRHVCILFRRMMNFRTDVARAYARGLEARHVPHVLVKGSSFQEREEIETMRNALNAIERPDDQLSVYATLHGPLFAFSDAELLTFKESVKTLHPFAPVDKVPESLAQVRAALDVLRELHRGRNRRPISDTIARLLAATRAHAGFAMWPTGEQALANISRVMDQARRFETRSGATSFRSFTEQLERDADAGVLAEAPLVEEGTEGVRLMTVHGAKGLEFPVVILADITCNEIRDTPQRYIDPDRGLCALRIAGCAPQELSDHSDDELRREREEATRLLYVATTRARDLLVVPVVGDERYDKWLGKLGDVLYPDPNQRRTALGSVPGCPEFGDDSVIERPPKAPPKAKSVIPGLHKPLLGTHRVVWWDPACLNLDVEETMGLRQRRLLEADESGKVSQQGVRAYEDWFAARAAMLASGSRPTITVATATELARQSVAAKRAAPDGIEPEEIESKKIEPEKIEPKEIKVLQLPRVAGRPHGPRFGTLVHATLLRVPFDADRGAIAAAAALQARMLGASAHEIDAATGAVETALRSPLMIQAASAAPDCRREAPLLVKLDDGVTMEGIADLAFVERANGQRRWVVVDFKTDADLAPRLSEYRVQLSLYIRAITQSTGEPARGVLLWL
ncbi:MAG: UvrD-helicase domain-containing protein [Candidatus Binatales bacterium]